jgi:hypothetical protein
MSKIKTLLDEIANCETCYGQGWLYYGDNESYDLDPCLCNPNSLYVGE